MLFGRVIRDGGHCWDVSPRSQPFLRNIQAAEMLPDCMWYTLGIFIPFDEMRKSCKNSCNGRSLFAVGPCSVRWLEG